VAVVRDDHHAALVFLQRQRQGVAHLEVEVVGRLVEQQQVGLLPDQQGQGEARLLAAGEIADLAQCHVAVEVEAAEVIADRSCSRVRGSRRCTCRSGRGVRAQRFELVLGEVADLQVAFAADAGERRRGRRRAGLISVDLPAPLRPSRPMRSPGRRMQLSPLQDGLSP
jgi:hypothetical protein